MSLSFEHILALDEFSGEDRLAIREAMRHDAVLDRAVRNWVQVSTHVRNSIEQSVPDTGMLVLFALKDVLSESDWTPAERLELEKSAVALSEALENHPAIEKVLDRVREDARLFGQCWDEAFRTNTGSSDTQRSLRDRPAHSRSSKTMRLVRWAVSSAAVIVLIAVGISRFSGSTDGLPFQIETVAGEMRLVTLQDGSTVRLGPESSMTWEGDFNRSLSLNGSAFFDVVASPEPFLIRTSQGLTTVLGTSFGIQTAGAESKTIVTLVSGRVSLSSEGLPDGVILTPGSQGLMTRAGIEVTQVNLTEALMWSELIVFRDTPMKEVIDVLAGQFEVKIELSETFREMPLTGTFERDRGIREILDIVAAAIGARVEAGNATGTFTLTSGK